MEKERKNVTVLVLGDFGRSPRMQYHSLSLLKRNFLIDVVAYNGSEPLRDITKNENVKFHYMNEIPHFFRLTSDSAPNLTEVEVIHILNENNAVSIEPVDEAYLIDNVPVSVADTENVELTTPRITWPVNNESRILPGIIRYVSKTLWQSLFLFFTLLSIPKMNYILLQNPPSIPTLHIACFISWWKKSLLIIDFHNYGFTILGLSAGKGSLLVKVAKWYEMYFSTKADNSLCVTKAMQADLSQNWNVKAHVFYDCAPDIFHPISTEEKHSLFQKLSLEYPQFSSLTSDSDQEKTRFFQNVNGKIEKLRDRPALIVSSTSWTEDEDFSVLLTALEDYEQAAKVRGNLPNLIVAITGKGPLKSFYEKQIEDKGFNHIEIVTMWLKSEDYPTFLACADLGISLHSSSSGLDLPMKIVDMFGCCLPVCALAFPCLDELVKDGVNGKIFLNSRQLSVQIQTLFAGYPESETDLLTYRRNLEQSRGLRWEENWECTVHPLFT